MIPISVYPPGIPIPMSNTIRNDRIRCYGLWQKYGLCWFQTISSKLSNGYKLQQRSVMNFTMTSYFCFGI